jgi:hypothetical protein
MHAFKHVFMALRNDRRTTYSPIWSPSLLSGGVRTPAASLRHAPTVSQKRPVLEASVREVDPEALGSATTPEAKRLRLRSPLRYRRLPSLRRPAHRLRLPSHPRLINQFFASFIPNPGMFSVGMLDAGP